MSAMKNLIENLRGIELCMADIKRTMNLDDVDSPLAMHGVSRLNAAPRHNVKSMTDARAVAAELDMRAIAGALDDGQIESISEQVQVDYCELATEISTEGLAGYLDYAEIAKHIRPDVLAAVMLQNPAIKEAVIARIADAVTERWYGRTDAVTVPAIRSDADPLTGIEYGTPT